MGLAYYHTIMTRQIWARGSILVPGLHLRYLFTRKVSASSGLIQKIIETAFTGNFGTVVVGRREVISFAREHFRGRFSEKIIKSLDNMAVWVVS